MLKLSRMTDYGVLVLHHLGRLRPARVSVETLAELTHLTQPTIRKVLHPLTRAGLVTAKRGPTGGYALARPAERITLAEAIAALQGPLALTDCCDSEGSCEIQDRCDLAGRWNGINALLTRLLEKTSLADLDAFGNRGQPLPPPLRMALGSPAN